MYQFNVEENTKDCVNWIKSLFIFKYREKNVIVPCSAGYSDAVCAALCKEALGSDRVILAYFPSDSESANYEEKWAELNIPNVMVKKNPLLWGGQMMFSEDTVKRLKFTALMELCEEYNAVLCCTLNMTQRWIGNYTLFADDLGMFAPIENFTDSEVRKIGEHLGITNKVINNISEFNCEVDRFLRNCECDEATREKIGELHYQTEHKRDFVNIDTFRVSATNLYVNPFN